MVDLVTPYGGRLTKNLLSFEDGRDLRKDEDGYFSVTLTNRQLCDLEMLATGGYSPLTGFMDQQTYDSVLENMILPSGELWPIPIVFDIDSKVARQLSDGGRLALRDSEGFMLAILHVSAIWSPDKRREAETIYGTNLCEHPGVDYLYNHVGSHYVSGQLDVLDVPRHYVFDRHRYSPQQMRLFFTQMGCQSVLGYQTSVPIHRLHKALLLDVAKAHQLHLLIQPTIGSASLGDTYYYHRVRCYEHVISEFPFDIVKLSLMPYSMRFAGGREGLLHAIIHQNYGCSHFLIGINHASPNERLGKQRFYHSDEAKDFVAKYQEHFQVGLIAAEEYQYQLSERRYQPVSKIEKADEKGISLSDKQFRDMLAKNMPIPEWFSFPEVVAELKRLYKPKNEQGITLFFTGLSGSGKSTLAKIVYAKLVEHGKRPVTLLDGDVVRLNLSSELSFSKEHRDLNVRRIGFVSNEISKNGGIAICAPIAPYAESRKLVREQIERDGGAFVEIHVSTPLHECEARDRKGLYAKARKGLIPDFTGISDPYDVPQSPELTIDTTDVSPLEGARVIVFYLLKQGFLDDDCWH